MKLRCYYHFTIFQSIFILPVQSLHRRLQNTLANLLRGSLLYKLPHHQTTATYMHTPTKFFILHISKINCFHLHRNSTVYYMHTPTKIFILHISTFFFLSQQKPYSLLSWYTSKISCVIISKRISKYLNRQSNVIKLTYISLTLLKQLFIPAKFFNFKRVFLFSTSKHTQAHTSTHPT